MKKYIQLEGFNNICKSCTATYGTESYTILAVMTFNFGLLHTAFYVVADKQPEVAVLVGRASTHSRELSDAAATMYFSAQVQANGLYMVEKYKDLRKER